MEHSVSSRINARFAVKLIQEGVIQITDVQNDFKPNKQ